MNYLNCELCFQIPALKPSPDSDAEAPQVLDEAKRTPQDSERLTYSDGAIIKDHDGRMKSGIRDE